MIVRSVAVCALAAVLGSLIGWGMRDDAPPSFVPAASPLEPPPLAESAQPAASNPAEAPADPVAPRLADERHGDERHGVQELQQLREGHQVRRPVLPGTPAAAPEALAVRWRTCEEFPEGLTQYDTVFWEPADTQSLRRLIRETDLVAGKTVLEIGTGTGLVALCCAKAGAARVVATDINEQAIANARDNASRFPFGENVEWRTVSPADPSAYAVLGPRERFDLIISNPPWEDGVPRSVDQYALYDPGFALLKSLLEDLRKHLNPGGRALLAYGCVDAVRVAEDLAGHYGLSVRILDTRDLNTLPPNFLPGMLLELTPQR